MKPELTRSHVAELFVRDSFHSAAGCSATRYTQLIRPSSILNIRYNKNVQQRPNGRERCTRSSISLYRRFRTRLLALQCSTMRVATRRAKRQPGECRAHMTHLPGHPTDARHTRHTTGVTYRGCTEGPGGVHKQLFKNGAPEGYRVGGGTGGPGGPGGSRGEQLGVQATGLYPFSWGLCPTPSLRGDRHLRAWNHPTARYVGTGEMRPAGWTDWCRRQAACTRRTCTRGAIR